MSALGRGGAAALRSAKEDKGRILLVDDDQLILNSWRRILRAVNSYADLEPELLGRVEELIDFVTVLSRSLCFPPRRRALEPDAFPRHSAKTASFLSPGTGAPFGSRALTG